MFLGKVSGNVVSTHKNKFLISQKLLIINQIDFEGNIISNKDIIAIDLIDAGIGDKVIVVQEGDAIQQVLGHGNAPVNTMIIALIDNVEIRE